jgi:large subunit ribosomal protein L9
VRILLRERVEKLGSPGDIVNVAAGFARNYLLPHNLAVAVSDENMRKIKKEQETRQKEAEKLKLELAELKEKLEQTSCTVVTQATEEGRLYGSVTTAMVVEALAKKGMEVLEKAIVIEEPIKELGIYEVKVHLGPEVEAVTKLWVVEEE